MYNCRTLTNDELLNVVETDRESRGVRFYNAVQAAFELVKRFSTSQLVSHDQRDSEVENAADEAYDQGYQDGQREERGNIRDYLTDYLVFKMKDKIEQDLIDQIIGRIAHEFPDMEPYKAKEESR